MTYLHADSRVPEAKSRALIQCFVFLWEKLKKGQKKIVKFLDFGLDNQNCLPYIPQVLNLSCRASKDPLQPRKLQPFETV